MNLIAVDDVRRILGLAVREIQKAAPDCSLTGFTSAREAIDYARENTVDAAFLDISMGEMSGLELAGALKEIRPETAVIFVTGYNEYIDDAFKMHCSGYIMKPVRAESVAIELARLRHNPPGADIPRLPDGIGPFTFDHAAQHVLRDGTDLLLTQTEYKILLTLAGSPGEYISPEELYAKVTGTGDGNHLPTLYAHIYRLRRHLGLKGDDIDIEHKRGKGYRVIVKPQ